MTKASKSVECRKKIAKAQALVSVIAKRINEKDCGYDERFLLMWNLAFVELQDLEDCRIPE